MDSRKRKEGVYQRSDSSIWWATYPDASGRRIRRSTGAKLKSEAVNLRNKWVTEVWNQTARGIQPDQSFEQVIVLYFRATANVKRSSETDKQRVKALYDFFPDGLLMNTLCSQDVRNYIADRQAKGIANKSINKELSLLSSAIKFVNSENDWSLPNPVQGKRLKEEEEEARCLTVEEARKLLDAASADLGENESNYVHNQNKYTKDYFPDFIVLGLNTMMRPGEMLNLEWSRVDFANDVINLKADDTKSEQPRKVPLNGHAKAALLRLRRLCDDNSPDTSWVFTHTKPRYFGTRIQSVTNVFKIAVKRAGIAHATPHCLRHSSITEAVHVAGANVVDIAKVAGHTNLSTTQGYIHTADDRAHKVVAELGKIVTI